jgi:uncharacterized CHY-type Zn-finger protein
MEATRSSETSVLTRTTRSQISEDGNPHIHRPENLKSYNLLKIISVCRVKLHIQFDSVHCVYIKHMYNNECRLHLTRNGQEEVV